jgi:hypothetical protein
MQNLLDTFSKPLWDFNEEINLDRALRIGGYIIKDNKITIPQNQEYLLGYAKEDEITLHYRQLDSNGHKIRFYSGEGLLIIQEVTKLKKIFKKNKVPYQEIPSIEEVFKKIDAEKESLDKNLQTLKDSY